MAFWTLYKREFNSYFQSAVAYVVLFGSAVIQSMFFVILVRFISDANYKDQSVMQIFFIWPLFWLIFLGQVPLITARNNLRLAVEQLRQSLGFTSHLSEAPSDKQPTFVGELKHEPTHFELQACLESARRRLRICSNDLVQ